MQCSALGAAGLAVCKESIRARRRQAGRVSMGLLLGLGILGGLVLYWYTTPQDAPSWVRNWLPGFAGIYRTTLPLAGRQGPRADHR